MHKFSAFLIPTLRDNPNDAETSSHRWMLRAGLIRKLAAGIYSMLPTGLRVQRKLEQIIREEMNRTGAQELLMPAVIPAELWQESGRWEQYGPELMRIKDRHDRDFVIGPTHEEVITDLVRNCISSYRQLPINLYQIQAKFRDEIRPRFGVMRGREFLMKDAYSFHLDWDSLHQTYAAMSAAYSAIFRRSGLAVAIVDADAGNIGGDMSQEFMVLADSGEDEIIACPSCGYGANVEKAQFRIQIRPNSDAPPLRTEIHTPNQRSIDEVSSFLKVPAWRMFKTLVYETDRGPVMVVIGGDRQVQETKLQAALNVRFALLMDDKEVQSATGAPVGFLGPIGTALPLYLDRTATALDWGVTGANRLDYHSSGVVQADLPAATEIDVAAAVAGDSCPKCAATMVSRRGIEVGHIFKLGDKYSQAMNATVLDDQGTARTMVMGCYGIGVTRTIAAAIEQNQDDKGICWPWSLAPWHLHIITLDPAEPASTAIVERLSKLEGSHGWELIVDDRQERPGVKFNDADILGCPLQVIVGARGLGRGIVEYKIRSTGARGELPLADLEPQLLALAEQAKLSGVYSTGVKKQDQV